MKHATHDELRDQTAAFALGALDDQARAEFEAHLLVCDECDDEVRSYNRVATALAYTVSSATPDPTLRQRIVDAAAPAAPGSAVGIPGGKPSSRRPSVLLPWLVAAACLVAAVGFGAYAVALRRAVVDSPSIVVILTADDLVRVDLAGQPVAPRASARAFWSRSRGLVFAATRLPPLPPGRTYQLWIISGQMPIGAGLLRPASDGAVEAVFTSPAGLVTAAAFAVTIEPDGGVPGPTGDKYLVGLVN